MLKRSTVLAIVLMFVIMAIMSGCTTMYHTVGKGPQKRQTETYSNWYILWGLAPVSIKDSKKVADEATDYKVTTQMTAVDWLVTILLQAVVPVGIQKWTVTVEK